MSLPAEMADGKVWESSTVMCLYPLRARASAVLLPQVPQPTIRTVRSALRTGCAVPAMRYEQRSVLHAKRANDRLDLGRKKRD